LRDNSVISGGASRVKKIGTVGRKKSIGRRAIGKSQTVGMGGDRGK